MEDPPWELIPVIEEDSDDIPILEENRDPIPVPPPRIRNAENVEIVEMASQVSRQRCIRVEGHDEGEEQSVLMGSNTTIY